MLVVPTRFTVLFVTSAWVNSSVVSWVLVAATSARPVTLMSAVSTMRAGDTAGSLWMFARLAADSSPIQARAMPGRALIVASAVRGSPLLHDTSVSVARAKAMSRAIGRRMRTPDRRPVPPISATMRSRVCAV